MDLDIQTSFSTRVITPYNYLDRTYYLLFYKQGIEGPFYVSDSPYALSHAMLTVGEVKLKRNDVVVGNVFHTTNKVRCGGSFLLAYSGVFKDSLSASIPKDFDMNLVLKTKYMQVFNKKNRATLVVSPNLKTNIRQNLEV